MTKKPLSGGTVHTIPLDMRKALAADARAIKAWEDLTPLARNEWICWVTFVKKDETRKIILCERWMNSKKENDARVVGLGVFIEPIRLSVHRYEAY